jgi:hypothetical protein
MGDSFGKMATASASRYVNGVSGTSAVDCIGDVVDKK